LHPDVKTGETKSLKTLAKLDDNINER